MGVDSAIARRCPTGRVVRGMAVAGRCPTLLNLSRLKLAPARRGGRGSFHVQPMVRTNGLRTNERVFTTTAS